LLVELLLLFYRLLLSGGGEIEYKYLLSKSILDEARANPVLIALSHHLHDGCASCYYNLLLTALLIDR